MNLPKNEILVFFLQFQWNLRGSFAQNSSCPRNLGKNHTKSGQNQCPGNGNFDTVSWQGRSANSVLCNEKSQEFELMGTKCVFLKTTWDWKKLSFDLNLMQKKGNCQTCKHCISLAFIYFYYPKWDTLQQYSSIVLQFSQNETFFKGLHPLCPPNAIHWLKFLATKNETFWRVFIHRAHLEWEKRRV